LGCVVVDGETGTHRDGGRGSASSSELRRSRARCTATLSTTVKQMEAAASPMAASCSGGVRVRAAASILRLAVSGGVAMKLRWQGKF
jgi:hypothetical protein